MTARPTRFLSLAIILVTLLLPSTIAARPEFARFTGQPCGNCHISPMGGGPLKPAGEEFRRSLRDLDIPMDPALRISTGQRLWHLTLYFLLIPFGIGWIGLFLYTFVPAMRRRTLFIPPRPYVRQMLYGIIVIAFTGPFMLHFRSRMVPGLFSTRFGLLLLLKIAAAVILFAATVVLLWHSTVLLAARYRRLVKTLESNEDLGLAPHELLLFDGSDRRKALVAADDLVYDVTGRNLWRKGIHPGGHHAGRDLTDDFKGAPHGKEVFDRVKPVGKLVRGDPKGKRGVQFWAVPVGMVCSVIILLVVALWRW